MLEVTILLFILGTIIEAWIFHRLFQAHNGFGFLSQASRFRPQNLRRL